jgi:hypothetical protein
VNQQQRDRKTVMNGEKIRLWKGIVQVYVKVLYQKSSKETEEEHDKYQSRQTILKYIPE